jgi:hypothetical protein
MVQTKTKIAYDEICLEYQNNSALQSLPALMVNELALPLSAKERYYFHVFFPDRLSPRQLV